jgi:hypothetical protein
MSEWMDAIREQFREPWKPLGPAALGLCLLVCGGLALWALTAADPWIPLLDGANLLFHEAGHPLFGIFGEGPGLYGGTFMQLLVPLVVAGNFAWRRETAPFALSLAWACQNLVNIARYAADAREQVLPLVGGGEHDWEGILLRWNALGHDLGVARTIRGTALLGLAALAGWLVLRYQRGER